MRGYRVDPRHKEAFELHSQGVSKAEVGRRFNVSPNTAGWWIAKYERYLESEPEYPSWSESLSTRAFLLLSNEFGNEVMKLPAEQARESIQQVDLLKIPNLGKRSIQEIMDALGASPKSSEPEFSESHAKACISYLEKWGYKVNPPDK